MCGIWNISQIYEVITNWSILSINQGILHAYIGLGYETAKELLRLGATVVLTGPDVTKVEAARAEMITSLILGEAGPVTSPGNIFIRTVVISFLIGVFSCQTINNLKL